MAINVSQSFHRTSSNAVDDTLTLTKAEMLAVNDNLMPAKYLTVCQDDGFIYLYDKSATPNSTTGKFTKFEGGSGGASALNDLTDVTISSAAQDQILKYNGSEWVNSSVPEDTTKYGTSDSASTDLADADYIPFYDSSASAKKKTLWSNIKTVLANTFQPKLTAGNNVTITDNTISASAGVIGVWSKSDIYSTTEKVIGCWTDGRPIYQKVVNFGTAPKNTPKVVNHGISNLGTVVEARAFTASTSEDNIQSNWAAISEGSFSLSYNKTSVIMTTRSGAGQYEDWSSFYPTVYVVMQYTKTSDAANSYNYSNENDYSTSEKIVGTWVDGSTLYQKTYIGTTSSSGSSTTVDSSFTYKIKRFFGALSYSSTSINNGGNIVMIGYGIDSNEGRLYAYTYNNKLYLWGSSSSYNFNNRGYALTVQYTK